MFHPTPRLRRASFHSLDGQWTVSVNGAKPTSITVPFPPEAPLSGVYAKPLGTVNLRYQKSFACPNDLTAGRLLLHFGAVDQVARVFLNGRFIGEHEGGYEAFTLDITDAVRATEENELTVNVTDRLDDAVLPYGKQKVKRGGMWYTPVSGIWQTVWLESVPETYIRALRVDTEIARDQASAQVRITAEGVSEGTVFVTAPDGPLTAPLRDGVALVTLSAPRLWSPEDPYLYEFSMTAGEDRVESYFALRSLTIQTVGGIPRLCLNGKPYFFHGLLDQGYFSGGIFTPASPACYERDILTAKSLGFNTLRKHIKVEPEQFYYACDRLGMVVFQDMVNNGRYSFLRDTALPTLGFKKRSDKRLHRRKTAREAFLRGMEAAVTQLRNHPCVCYWTVFNEGWGQFDGDSAYQKLRRLDDTRFIDTVSGWFKGAASDVNSEHIYFKPVKLTYGERPTVLSEFGGYACKIKDHAYDPNSSYGYRHFSQQADFEDALVKLYEEEIIPAARNGLCAAIYTQLTDVEDEVNGLITYDRAVVKVSPARMIPIAEALQRAVDHRIPGK